ncbi:MAG: hypothetical protein AAGA85_28135 [Bacteroidota bacterium]
MGQGSAAVSAGIAGKFRLPGAFWRWLLASEAGGSGEQGTAERPVLTREIPTHNIKEKFCSLCQEAPNIYVLKTLNWEFAYYWYVDLS